MLTQSEEMATSKIYAVFYRPHYGNYKHWALHVHTHDGDDFIFQVLGSHGTFEAQAIKEKSTALVGYLEQTLLTTINSEELPLVQQVVQKVYVDNETTEWDCQDYVI